MGCVDKEASREETANNSRRYARRRRTMRAQQQVDHPAASPRSRKRKRTIVASTSTSRKNKKTSTRGKKSVKQNQQHRESYRDKHFDRGFKNLITYKEQNGHTNVPYEYDDLEGLGVWVNNARRKFKIKFHQLANRSANETASQKKSLDKYQSEIDRLNGIGFSWDPREASWERQFADFRAYVIEHKRIKIVPGNDEKLLALKDWYNKQNKRATPERAKKIQDFLDIRLDPTANSDPTVNSDDDDDDSQRTATNATAASIQQQNQQTNRAAAATDRNSSAATVTPQLNERNRRPRLNRNNQGHRTATATSPNASDDDDNDSSNLEFMHSEDDTAAVPNDDDGEEEIHLGSNRNEGNDPQNAADEFVDSTIPLQDDDDEDQGAVAAAKNDDGAVVTSPNATSDGITPASSVAAITSSRNDDDDDPTTHRCSDPQDAVDECFDSAIPTGNDDDDEDQGARVSGKR